MGAVMDAAAPDLLIRPARLHDAAALVALLNPIIEARIYTALDTPSTPVSQRAFIEGLPERAIYLVAEDRATGRIVGCQDLLPFSDYTQAFDHVGIMGTFVDLAFHRRGIAARLFTATYEAAAALGYEKIFTYIRADNDAGLRAYGGQGFRVVGTASRHAKIDGRYIDEVIVERFI